MQLNLRTAIALITWLALGFTVLATTVRWARRAHPGYRRWAIAGLLLVLSLFLLSLQSAPAWIHAISANSGIALASILYLEGAREFRGLAPCSWPAYAGGVAVLGAVAFSSYVVPSMNSRATVMSAFLAVVFTLVSISLLRGIPPAHRFGLAFTGGMFALCGATLLARAFYCCFGPPMSDRNMLSGIHGAFFFATVVEMSAFSLGLGFLADEQVVSALNEVKKRASSAGTEVARLIEAQALLRESEERFRFAQRAAGIGTFDWNIETGVNTWTPELEALYGLPPGGFAGTQEAWENLVHPDDRTRVLHRVTESYRTGSPAGEEWRVVWPDGSLHWIAGRWQVFQNAGEPLRMMGVNVDVTDRKNMEEAVRKSEERFRLAVKATNDAIWDIDLKARTVSWNDTYSTLYGRPEEADSWQFWIDRIHPEDRSRTADAFRAALDRGASIWVGEYRFRRADGKWAHIYDRAYIARDTSGNAWRVIGAMQDLTEQKKAETGLRQSEERFRRVFEEGPLGLALVGRDYRFVKVNSALCQMVGYSEAELVQKTFAEITYPDDVRADVELADRLFKREIPFYRIQKRYVKKTGEIIWINLTASIILGADGEPLDGIAMVEDITEVRRSQEEALVRQKLESLGTLAGGIAHDFNNILGAVQAQAEVGLAALSEGLPCKEEMKSICEVTLRGSEIVRQLMIYAGKEDAVVGPIDLSTTVDEMLSLLKISVTKRAVIETHLDRDLPAIRASAAQLRQIVMNLITNASDAIGDREGVVRVITKRVTLKGESGAISTRMLPDGDYVQLEVCDTGCGMSSQTLAKVFDPFFTTKSAGRGLGLAVVQGIVRGLGGTINLTSELDKGTTFQVWLPCEKTTPGASDTSMPRAEELALRSGGATVLVVEDEVYLRQAVVKLLRKNGFEVFEAADGSSAIDVLRADGDNIDVILLDMTIPGAPSQEVIREVVNARPNIKVVLTSAYDQKTIAGALRAPQIQNFIRKPFQLGDLLKILRSALSS